MVLPSLPVLTSFDTARGDIDLLSGLPFSVIFVDEAHRIKNPASKVTQAFHQFSCQARFGLTGTAIQNAYDELFTLLDWTNPGRVGTAREWRTKISKPLTVGQSAKATETERATSKVSLTIPSPSLPAEAAQRSWHTCLSTRSCRNSFFAGKVTLLHIVGHMFTHI